MLWFVYLRILDLALVPNHHKTQRKPPSLLSQAIFRPVWETTFPINSHYVNDKPFYILFMHVCHHRPQHAEQIRPSSL